MDHRRMMSAPRREEGLMRFDLLIASASAGLLVYSGGLLVPTARLRPEDIIAYRYPRGSIYLAGGGVLGADDVPFPVFPEGDAVLDIRDVLGSRAGLALLVFGTIGGVVALIVGAFAPSLNVPSLADVVAGFMALLLGYGAGWWWTARPGLRGKQERRLLVHCFLAWLEREVGDPKAKGYDLGLSVISTARTSGFTMLGDLLVDVGIVRTDAEDEAAARKIVALAREYRYHWRRGDVRKWASEVASKDSR